MTEPIYFAAVYLRLSKDDGDIDGSIKSESNSISAQRELAFSYLREHEEIELFDIYADDGYSGVNFDRPQFKRMMSDIEAGHVNCVIVKDLSRLGRDYIEAGRLLQKTFPAFHVRFIAIADQFDSQTADHTAKSLVLPIKNFINDSYCRDISQKVKSHQKIKREQGKFISPFAMYGYRKSAEDKNKLCPDGYAADIVRRIFAWKLEGMSALAIAERLNGLGIRSPMEYKKFRGEKFCTSFQKHAVAKWSAAAVKRILDNEVYTGVLVQGKNEQINYKVKKTTARPRKEWARVEGTHEAIVPQEDFAMVQALLAVDTRGQGKAGRAHLFSGLLFCGDCKEPMIRRVNRCKGTSRVYFICPTRNRGQGCTRHSVPQEELKTVVFRILQIYTAINLEICSQLEYIQRTEVHFEEVSRLAEEIERFRKEQEKYLELRNCLREDLKTGLITETDFKNFRTVFETQYQELKNAVFRQEKMKEEMLRSGIAAEKRLEKFKKDMELTELNRDALLCFISRIEVYEHKKIYIEFRSREEFSGILALHSVRREA